MEYFLLPFLTSENIFILVLGYHRALRLLSLRLMYTGCRTALTAAARKREMDRFNGPVRFASGLKMREKTGIVRVSIQVIHFVEEY